MDERFYDRIMQVILIGLVVGMLGMIQPFSLALFKPAFLILFYCTLGYIVFSHINPRPAKKIEDDSTAGPPNVVEGEEQGRRGD
ncbi:MAG: hypothetical protein PHQ40_02740 [Anaerolineaceae bacterium]|nr:hypothetical protein [Anaerolineaceae bacterium]